MKNTAETLHITLTYEEYTHLMNASFIPTPLFNKLVFMQFPGKVRLSVPESTADHLRDIFGTRLQIVGFDENYTARKEGEILESLIDKFYI